MLSQRQRAKPREPDVLPERGPGRERRYWTPATEPGIFSSVELCSTSAVVFHRPAQLADIAMPVLDAKALTTDPEGLAFLRDVLATGKGARQAGADRRRSRPPKVPAAPQPDVTPPEPARV
jgi:hypothetical protein